MKRFVFVTVVGLLSFLPQQSASAAGGPVFFPKGPYDSELLSLDILKGPAADFTGILLPDGTIRGYAPSVVDEAHIIFESKDDGRTFTRIGKVDYGPDYNPNLLGQPRVVLLNDGKYHLYTNNSRGITCYSSTDGLRFSLDKVDCIPNSIIPTPPHYKNWRLSSPGIVILADGTYRAYFGDEGAVGDGAFPPHQLYSATSRDGVTWTREPGVRIGFSSSGLKTTAMHPDVIQHADGSVTIFYRTFPFQNQAYATSKDGLNFEDEHILWWGKQDPVAGYGNEGGDPSLVKDRNGNIVLFQGTWIPNSVEGGVSSIRLTVGKGTKFGEETGRDLNVHTRTRAEHANCVVTGTPSDPAYARVTVMAEPNAKQPCPDGYSVDSANPQTIVYGPSYANVTQCLWQGTGAAPNGWTQRYFSGVASCPQGYRVGSGAAGGDGQQPASGNQQMPSSGGSANAGGTAPKQVSCYAKPGMIVNNPMLKPDGSGSCPPGYSTAKTSAKQVKITCTALPGIKVNQPVMTFVGIGKTPNCPKGYKKK